MIRQATLEDLEKELNKRCTVVWTTKSGEQIPIEKMSDNHLVNAINMVRRAKEKRFEYDMIMEDLRGLTMDDIC